MTNRKASFVLPVIPTPPHEAFIIEAKSGFTGPIFSGSGPISLHCGRCMYLLVQDLYPTQIENLIIKCPNSRCNAFNAIVSIPTLENLIGRLQNTPPATLIQLPELVQILTHAQHNGLSKEKLHIGISRYMPDFEWIVKLLIPKDNGDFFGTLSFFLALLTWYQSRPSKKRKPNPKQVVHDFFSENIIN